MTTELQVKQQIEFSPEQVALIKSQVAPNASDNELCLFLYQAQRSGLDPLTRQIYCIHRGGKMTIQTSIDGFRVIAERSGDYGGQDEPIFTEQDGRVISCKITVYRFRGDVRYAAAVGVAFMSEYNAGGPMWQKMPHTMLAKCAEALALRKAYPQDLSGLYTSDEMQQADYQPAEVVVQPATPSQQQPPTVEPAVEVLHDAWNMKYSDPTVIFQLIDQATSTDQLRSLYIANGQTFVSNPDMKKKLDMHGIKIKAKQTAAQTA